MMIKSIINPWKPERGTGVPQTIKMHHKFFYLKSEICEFQCCLMKSYKTKDDKEKMEIPPSDKKFYIENS